MTFAKSSTDTISESLYEFIDAAGLGREPADEALFHYTTAAGLRGILSSGAMFASHAKFFNDTSEFEYRLSMLEKPLQSLAVTGLAEVRDHILNTFKGKGGYEIFVSCFCEHDDLIPQWRGYGAAGAGYAIGIPWRDLSREGSALLIGVTYGEKAFAEAASKAIQLAKTRAADALGLGGAGGQARMVDTISSLMVTLLLLVIATKKSGFEYEHEFRLIYLLKPTPLQGENPIEFRDAGGLIIPYVLLPLPRDESGRLRVASVRCGPSLQDSATADGVRMLLAKHGVGDVSILRSEAPLRAV